MEVRTPRFIGHETFLFVYADGKHLLDLSKRMARACIEIPPQLASFVKIEKTDLVMPQVSGFRSDKSVTDAYDNVEAALRKLLANYRECSRI